MNDEPANNLAFVRVLIGDEALKILAKHVIEGTSVRDLAEQLGLPKSTIHDRLRRVQATLERHGLWPIVDRGLSTRRKEPPAPSPSTAADFVVGDQKAFPFFDGYLSRSQWRFAANTGTPPTEGNNQ
jgi:hypothetical protein